MYLQNVMIKSALNNTQKLLISMLILPMILLIMTMNLSKMNITLK